jgi:hypothetical protein
VRRTILGLAFAALLVSGCGSDEDAPTPGADDGLVADLRVVVRPQGQGGPERVRRIECRSLGAKASRPRCRELGGLEPGDLEPVPARTACTQIYGGPATARVTGALRGERVSASFELTDGCEINRWRRNAALLGPPPGHGS